MKRLTTIAILLGAACCAHGQTGAKSDKPAATPRAVTIPKDAVKNPDGTYGYTDKQGKKWTYANTPFGVIKTAVTDDAGKPAAVDAAIKVIDKGDTVRFERPGPFGTMSWEKKKSELTDEERQIVEKQNQTRTQTAKPDAK